MVHRVIGQEELRLVAVAKARSLLDDLHQLLDWAPVALLLGLVHASAKAEAAWPPLAMFKALLLSIWYDLSEVKLAEALDDRASFRRFCGFSSCEATPERTAFVRFRRTLVKAGLDRAMFETVNAQLKAKAIRVKTGTIVDATIIASASKTSAGVFMLSASCGRSSLNLLTKSSNRACCWRTFMPGGRAVYCFRVRCMRSWRPFCCG